MEMRTSIRWTGSVKGGPAVYCPVNANWGLRIQPAKRDHPPPHGRAQYRRPFFASERIAGIGEKPPYLHNFGAVANCDRVRMYFTDYVVSRGLDGFTGTDEERD